MQNFETINDYWAVIVGFITLVMGYTTLKLQNIEQEKRLTNVEKKVEQMNPIFTDIRERLIAIETTLKLIAKDK